ncbi:MAG: AI-2E family transporter, partial [Bacteroidota bacterium]
IPFVSSLFRQALLALRVMWLASALFLLWFLHSLSGVLAPFVVAFLLAYILNPLVSQLEARRFPRWASSLVSVCLLIGLVVLVAIFVVPPAIQQFEGIISGVTAIVQDVSAMLQSGRLFEFLSQYGVPVEKTQSFVVEQLSPRLEKLLSTLFEGLFGFVSGFSSVVLHLINIIIIPFLLFYMLKDFPHMLDGFALLAPSESRNRVREIGSKVDEILGRYFRGAIIVAIIQGTISAIGLTVIGVKYSLVLGIMTGILNFIPYVGLLASLAVSCIVALLSGEPIFIKVIGVVVLYLSQKLLEAGVLGPKIVGTKVGLHPVMLILCLLVFGYFLGFVGMLIAVPSTALLMAALNAWTLRREVQTVQGS